MNSEFQVQSQNYEMFMTKNLNDDMKNSFIISYRIKHSKKKKDFYWTLPTVPWLLNFIPM